MKPLRKRWSKPADAFRYLGILKSGSIVFTAAPSASVAPGFPAAAAHDVGGVAMFAALNVGTASEVVPLVTPLQVSAANPLRPELPNALERYTNGGGPLNEPMPPRS